MTREQAIERAKALLLRVRRQAEVLASHGAEQGQMTLRVFAKDWLNRRRMLGKLNVLDDESRLKNYVLARLGDMPLTSISPLHVAVLLSALAKKKSRIGGTLAPKTIRNVYAVLRSVFRDAEIRGVIPVGRSPCILRDTEYLPPPRDKVAGWRETACFRRSETDPLRRRETDPQGDVILPLFRSSFLC